MVTSTFCDTSDRLLKVHGQKNHVHPKEEQAKSSTVRYLAGKVLYPAEASHENAQRHRQLSCHVGDGPLNTRLPIN
jgi:hypothetical protein